MAKFDTIAEALRKAIATNVQARSYEFTFPRSDDFHLWLPKTLDDPRWTRRWMSKRNPSALYNQIIEREQISVRSFPPGDKETEFGVYVIGDAMEGNVLYVGKSQCNGTPVVVRLLDHFVPPLSQYRNNQSMQNTPLIWNRHIRLGKKLKVVYCDNMHGLLAPNHVESKLRKLVYDLDGDYPPYDGYSRFSKVQRSPKPPRASRNTATKGLDKTPGDNLVALNTAQVRETFASFLDRMLASGLPFEKIVEMAKSVATERGLRTKVTASKIRAHIAFRRKHQKKSR